MEIVNLDKRSCDKRSLALSNGVCEGMHVRGPYTVTSSEEVREPVGLTPALQVKRSIKLIHSLITRIYKTPFHCYVPDPTLAEEESLQIEIERGG